MPASSPSIYDQIGGKIAVSSLVVKLYKKILSDETLQPFFERISIERLQASQSAFVTMALGGPNKYTGRTLRVAHQHLVETGLSDIHFNLVARYLKDSMKELSIPAHLIDQAMAIVESTREDVLNHNKS